MSGIVVSEECLSDIRDAAHNAENEEQLKVSMEMALKSLFLLNHIPWNPYTLEKSLLGGARRLDVIHGTSIIEYEPPRSFGRKLNRQALHAQAQVEEYSEMLAIEEGRSRKDYTLVVSDGVSISFGRYDDGGCTWQPLRDLDEKSLQVLLSYVKEGGSPLINPSVLNAMAGVSSRIGIALIPALFNAVYRSVELSHGRTYLIFREWARMFAQVDGVQTERLVSHLREMSELHGCSYDDDPQAYMFALSTYIALVAKITAVFSLSQTKNFILNTALPVKDFLRTVEDGDYFIGSGVSNLLTNDFFSWYLNEENDFALESGLSMLVDGMLQLDFNMGAKSNRAIRDLFKGLYMTLTPGSLRHALGEYYTPDWLSEHVLDNANWDPYASLLDPTCGSGTMLLEALKRRVAVFSNGASAGALLEGLYGFDLNPLAVLTSKISIMVFLLNRLDADNPITIPVFLADAINTCEPDSEGNFYQSIPTEKGVKTFVVPEILATDPQFFEVMSRIKTLVDAGLDSGQIMEAISGYKGIECLSDRRKKDFLGTISELTELHKDHWNGIWCSILFDRISAGCVKDVDVIVGNPPWVKWTNLPRTYSEFIKPVCKEMGIFSDDTWVGGIESDISTVVTYKAVSRFLSKRGRLVFLITGTVFKNESSQGFRRWTLPKKADSDEEPLRVVRVEDFRNLKPFEGATNWTSMIVLERGSGETVYPVPYGVWYPEKRGASRSRYIDISDFEKKCLFVEMQALPVPGIEAGPWVTGTAKEILAWKKLFRSRKDPLHYHAHKGVTTDANGIFFVEVKQASEGLVKIQNNPANGKRVGIPSVSCQVEEQGVYPLLRGRDVGRFMVKKEASSGIVLPQSGMHGDPDIPSSLPKTFLYLARFERVLAERSSYKRFQKNKPYWSVWSVGSYSFSPYKVVWREMVGSSFEAAFIGPETEGVLKGKSIVPDHKVYFVGVETLAEAAYLAGFLNAPLVSSAIKAYASTLSLGASVCEYIFIPPFDPKNEAHVELSNLAKKVALSERVESEQDEMLDHLVSLIISDARERG